ncbi:MAG TPA: hypothetical protein VHH35_07055, partial [Pyrinomonadaceae bacterium]|nr:hypothetical protein [Pyrinomonadaceae bacterium]
MDLLILRRYELHATVRQFGKRSCRYSPKHRVKDSIEREHIPGKYHGGFPYIEKTNPHSQLERTTLPKATQ